MNRRTFLATSTALAASAVFSSAEDAAKKRPKLKKAVNLGMAGGVKGSVTDKFKAIRDAGFDGIELNLPGELTTDQIIEAKNASGLEVAGISILAVSTEPADELHKTYSLAKGDDGFAFPILADPTFAAFKTYRAYDDFETMALHGTFLIDADGLVRWQDISYQPFTQAKWLLAESKRLLALPRAAAAAKTLSSAEGKVLSSQSSVLNAEDGRPPKN